MIARNGSWSRLASAAGSDGDAGSNPIVSPGWRPAQIAGMTVVVVGCAVLGGWAFDVEPIKRGHGNLVAMNPVTAISFVLLGFALLLQASTRANRRARRVSEAMALLVCAVGVLKLAGTWTGWEAGFDQWFFRSKLAAGMSGGTNQIAPNTALNFMLVGLAFLLVAGTSRSVARWGQGLALVSVLDALLALLGYAYGVGELYGFMSAIPMALPTAITFLVLAIGILFMRPDGVLMRLLNGRGVGVTLLRRLLPAAILVPVGLGCFRLALERHGYFDSAFGVALMVVFNIAFVSASIWLNALWLERLDAERTRIEQQLRTAHDELEERVRERTTELASANEGLRAELLERERIQGELHRSEAEFRAIFDVTAVGVAQTDALGRYLHVNRKFCDLAGYSADELLGISFSEITHPEDRQRDATTFFRLQAGEIPEYVSEKRYVRKDGTPIWASVSAAPLRDELGRPSGVVAVIQDVTARRLHEQAIQDLNQRLEQRLERLGALRRIDLAITSSLDIRVTLNTVLDQVVTQLGVDATSVLLLDPSSHVLSFACGRGFRTARIAQSSLRLGEGIAGRAALERRTIHISDLPATDEPFMRSRLVEHEGFISYAVVPLVAKGQIKGVLEVFHRSALDPDAEWRDYFETLAGQAAIAIDGAVMFEQLQRANDELTVAYDATIEGWSRALDLRDRETEGHTQRVTEMSVRLGRHMGLSEADLVHLRRGALLHDIGKMGVPDSILLKPGPLTEEEWRIMRLHPEYAFEWLSPIPFLRPALDVPYAHHERWDGSGYPRGLKGDAIPLAARIFTAVDIWDALSSDRPYRRGWPSEEVRAHLQSLAGVHLDAAVVEVFLQLLDADHTFLPRTTDSDTEPNSRPSQQGTNDGETPATDLSTFAAVAPEPDRTGDADRVTILLAENQSPSISVMTRTLQALGHEVVSASDGNQAWEIVRSNRARLVIAEWSLSGIDGLELCRRIRSQLGELSCYVILTTGRMGDDAHRQALRAGADDVLVKPIDSQDLIVRLERARRILGRQLEIERQNLRLVELATTDELTGLKNSRHFREALESAFSYAIRRERPLSLLLMAIDRFKAYNEAHGRQAGDHVLRTLAQFLGTEVRPHDTVARLGGDVFAMLFPETEVADALAIGERLRATAAGHVWPHEPICFSIGVATLPRDALNAVVLLEQAELALSRTKTLGLPHARPRTSVVDLRPVVQ